VRSRRVGIATFLSLSKFKSADKSAHSKISAVTVAQLRRVLWLLRNRN
jgi:hypothetical protein